MRTREPIRRLSRRLVDEVCAQFPEEVRRRGVSRGYFDFIWMLDHVLTTLGRDDLTGIRAIDIGAGAGVVSLGLARLGASVAAIDIYEEYADGFENQMGSADAILGRFKANGVAPVFAHLEAAPHLPIKDGSVDLALLLNVIEHLHESPKPVLEEVHRTLKPGGAFVVATPNIGWIRTRLRLAAGRTVHFPIDEWYESPRFYGHIREYTLSELRAMMHWAGFTVTLAGYGNRTHLSTRERNEQGAWTNRFRINSLQRVVEAGAIGLAQLVPSLRYMMIVVGLKPGAPGDPIGREGRGREIGS